MMKNIGSKYSNSRLTNIQEGDKQPNAVDLRLAKVFSIGDDEFILSDTIKQHRGKKELAPNESGFFWLDPGFYEIVMQNEVSLFKEGDAPFGDTGLVIARSTLIRNGVTIESGLYDSGYVGPIVAGMRVEGGSFGVAYGTRIAQFLLFFAEADTTYTGSYGYAEDGTIKKHDERYVKKE